MSREWHSRVLRLVFGLNTFLCSGLLYLSAAGSSAWGEIREIRVFDGPGLFRAQGVIAESVVPAPVKATPEVPSELKSITPEAVSTAITVGATVEVLLDTIPGDGLRLSPLDFIGDPLSPQMVGERDGKLLFHFYGVRNGSWEINVPSEALLEVRILLKK